MQCLKCIYIWKVKDVDEDGQFIVCFVHVRSNAFYQGWGVVSELGVQRVLGLGVGSREKF